jgi:cation diffusion facilitator CzcD-associated flavoprotein CzcO
VTALTTTHGRPIAVIGAGPSGLATCKNLRNAGLAFECFDAASTVGGIWNVEAERSGGYRSLHTNTSTGKMMLSEFPFPEGTPDFPDHSEMLRYFEAYTEHFGLADAIRLETAVDAANPTDDGGWRLRFADGSEREFAACVVATGQYGTPRMPEPAPEGSFSGEQIHAFDYLDAQTPIDCTGKRVVVVGLGSSAAEIATELGGGREGPTLASEVILSARSGRYIVPKRINGKPLDDNSPHPTAPLPKTVRWVPEAVQVKLMQSFINKVFGGMAADVGDPAKWNLPSPRFPAYEERPTISDGFISALDAGRVQGRPGIAGFAGNTVRFSDDTAFEADLVIWGTGYHLAFPFLSRDVLGCDAPDLALYRRIVHPTQRNLYFIGFTRVLCSLWPVSEVQAVWLSHLLRGDFELPPPARQAKDTIAVAQALPVFCNLHAAQLRADFE